MNMKNEDTYRPYYHFTPKKGWMNDPNGLVYYKDNFHLFYQHVPDSLTHSNDLHWGHATSRNLNRWKHKEIALSPDENGSNWSGSVVVDWQDTGNFQTGRHKTMVALYTQAVNDIQCQCLAYSNDKGETWTSYKNNPVITNPGIKDFRDPKVFWFAPSNCWKMVLAAGDRILVYGSEDLRRWALASEFMLNIDYPEVVCECPDLFELHFKEGPDESRWVMIISLTSDGPNGGSGTQFFIGAFDGWRFIPEPAYEIGKWLDYGKDCYAGVTFSDIPAEDGRRILMAWMNNWEYADKLPTRPWKGMMTLAREISLHQDDKGSPWLKSTPVNELKQLRKDNLIKEKQEKKSPYLIELPIDSGQAVEVILEYETAQEGNLEVAFYNESDDAVKVICDHRLNEMQIDRSASEKPFIHDKFADHPCSAPLSSQQNSSLHIFIDSCSIEIFADGGYSVLSSLVFPQRIYSQMRLSYNDDFIKINNLEMWRLN